MLIAITRCVSPSLARCELTHLTRVPIDPETACLQHRQYEATLASLGVEVHSLPVQADQPDSVFVEDTAVVVDECAVITRPGADSRRAETVAVVQALASYRRLFHVQSPGSLDGGDVLCVGKHIYIGLSTRSNQAAIDQMKGFLTPYQFIVEPVEFAGCLHLKSAVTQVSPHSLLINPALVNKASFANMKTIEVDASEPYAANALMIGESVVYQPTFPRTLKRLRQTGLRVVLVDMSELGKAEGALTCCSLIFNSHRKPARRP
jgi:dimethylargininase